MGKTLEKVEKKIIDEVEREFPGDPALQKIHISRGIILKEVEESGCSLREYIENYFKKS